jgi:hypothetical protein
VRSSTLRVVYDLRRHKALFANRSANMNGRSVSAFLACVALRLPRTPHLSVTEIRVKHIGDEFQALWQRKVIDKPASDSRPQAPTVCAGTSRFREVPRQRPCFAVIIPGAWRVTRAGKRRCLLVDIVDILADQNQSRVIASLLEAAYADAVASGDHVFEVLGLPRNVGQI